MSDKPQIYRFKFHANFMNKLETFADKHRLDEPDVFKEMWLRWSSNENNISEIIKEEKRLIGIGYEGDIGEKMYKTVRYYLKNKSVKKKEPKKRRKYMGVQKILIQSMDTHICEEAFNNELKPAHAYNNYCSMEPYATMVETEINRLIGLDMNEKEAMDKIKKTYKNRYYLKQKKKDE